MGPRTRWGLGARVPVGSRWCAGLPLPERLLETPHQAKCSVCHSRENRERSMMMGAGLMRPGQH